MTIGERIKAKRKELGLSQEELAHRLGNKSRASVSTVEHDKEDLTTTRIAAYAEALECTPAYLMGWDDLESFDTPEEFELRWHQIGGGRHSLILSDDEQELVLEYRVASDDDKRMVRRMLAYATKMKGGDPNGQS